MSDQRNPTKNTLVLGFSVGNAPQTCFNPTYKYPSIAMTKDCHCEAIAP
ncbi:MAG: hypothetical protein F6K23_01420 [Okeania sp. SIO2C9]|nr:hypothetical protein [Okeania sp. SIO2C9]NEQ71854.1 hypothetical protein [Okeania sp. SIO2C9]